MVTATGVHTFDRSLIKAREWLSEVQDELNFSDQERAYNALRAVMHTLRDRLTVDQAADFAAQLPLFLKGIFFEGWNPRGKPIKFKTKEDFFNHVAEELRPDMDSETVTRGIFRIFSKHISSGEIEKTKYGISKDIAELFE